MEKPKFPIYKCMICNCDVQMGGGKWGIYKKAWDATFCRPCYSMNADGFVDEAEIVAHLKEKNIDPNILKRNASGYIVRPD